MRGCLGRRWLENKNERTYSISEGSQCMELWPFTVSTSLYFKTHPFERDSHQGPQAIPDHHQNPYFSGHKRGKRQALWEPAGLELRCLDVDILICVHETGAGNCAELWGLMKRFVLFILSLKHRPPPPRDLHSSLCTHSLSTDKLVTR